MVDHQFQYSEQNDIPIPQTIGEYKVIDFVSRDTGSQGSVYKAIGPDDTLVAVKVIGNSLIISISKPIYSLVEGSLKVMGFQSPVVPTLISPELIIFCNLDSANKLVE